MLPNMVRRLRIRSITAGSFESAAPATRSLNPERYLVAEYSTRLAPSFSGC